MSTLMQASRQWATRPDDQRFLSLTALNSHFLDLRARSKDGVVQTRQLEAIAIKDEGNAMGDLVLTGPRGGQVHLTHWSFGQLSARAGAPAQYLRGLPAALAADNINYGLKVARESAEAKVLLTSNGRNELRAITGPDYGRVWNSSISTSLVNRFGDGVTGNWRVPGIFGRALTSVTKDNTTLFASDRDMFVFLADEERRIDVPNRRNGQSGSLARGFFVWNSEVGADTLGVATFLFDYVCSNRIVWGCRGIS